MKTQTKNEMNLNEIETPETDAMWDDCEDSCGNPMVAVDVDFARDLERRLTVAREALKNVCETSSSTRIVKLAHETLTTTAPKL